jgi:hypothetical protein
MYSLGPVTKRVVCTLDSEAVLATRDNAAQLAAQPPPPVVNDI